MKGILVGMAVGYVLGAKAGRERYDQIVRTWHRIAENPTVRKAAGTAKDKAFEAAHTAKDVVAEKSHVLAEKAPWKHHDLNNDLNEHPVPPRA
ncbi:YtxH domain-containing protein [Lentzea sp. NPDC051213]|uniref:YtxH domain-containing protein n=1 Tax=Lentzea sp. NPDC051213 TaxID=3364126 RepID=UPI00379F920A